ncbi:MAG: hypothetical protein H7249_08755 [Chitinophagaceae bacterium]|nr:hypothetical protein [Oligoflexus sp.]
MIIIQKNYFGYIGALLFVISLTSCTLKSPSAPSIENASGKRSRVVESGDLDKGADKEKSSPKEEESKNEAVTPPSVVTGGYLYCQILEKDISSASKAQVGCRINEPRTNVVRKVDLEASYNSYRWDFQKLDDSSIVVSKIVPNEKSLYQIIFLIEGTTKPLGMETVKNLRIDFAANPVGSEKDYTIFASQLADEGPYGSILPEEYSIYFKDGIAVNAPLDGFEKRALPTINRSYAEIDGCYVACYSESAEGSVYPISTNIYVMGQYRVKGHYVGAGCVGAPVQKATEDACKKYFPGCADGKCTTGGDTGGWFGL